MLGLTFDKLLILGFVAVILVGPQRLPMYAAKLATFVKAVKGYADGAKDRLNEELGPDFEDVDWKKLDPRQYDPRRIIASALLDDEPAPVLSPIRRVGGRHSAVEDEQGTGLTFAEVDATPAGEKIAGGTAE